MFEVESDPQFKAKFDEPIGQQVSTLENVLKSIGVKDEPWTFKADDGVTDVPGLNLKLIREQGGVLKYFQKDKEGLRAVLSALDQKDPIAKASFERNIAELAVMEGKRAEELGKIKSNAQQYLQQRQKESEAAQQQFAKQQEQGKEVLNNYRQKEYERHDAFKLIPIPEKSSADERAKIEKLNIAIQANRDNLAKAHDMLFWRKATPDELAEGGLRAVLYAHEAEKNKALTAELAQVKEENARLKKAQLIRPAGTITPPPPQRITQPVQTNPQDSQSLAGSVLEQAERL